MASDVLSVIPYFGGKAKMAPLICNMLDYDNTEIYIEPFGGGARVLLNKPRHKVDIYNDSSVGLNALFECLSDDKTGQELINQLLDTEPSEELFNWALEYRNSFDDDLQTVAYNQLKVFVKRMSIKYGLNMPYRAFRGRTVENKKTGKIKDDNKEIEKDIERIEPLRKKMSADENAEFAALCKNYLEVLDAIELAFDLCDIELVNEKGISYYDNLVELAKATFIVYQLSYNGTANGYSRVKGENIDGYHRCIDNLYRAIEQLEGIKTVCADAQLAFIQDVAKVVETNNDDSLTEYTISKLLYNPKVMMYLDPTYLKPGDEHKNLGEKGYKHSWTYQDHEKFLRLICGAKCKILVSNYDVDLYNKYLNKANGWSRVEFETTTSVAQSSDNDISRTEVLWCNY